MDTEHRGTFASLRVRNFRLFVVGQLLSNVGTWMQLIALPLLVLQMTNSGVALGLVTALGYLPILLFGAWGGVLADRVDNWRLLLWTQLGFAALAFALWAVVATGVATVWMVYVLTFATGVVTAVDMPTRQSFYLELVGRDDLTNAMSLNTATFTGARIVGAALGGALVAWIGLAPLFLVNGISYMAVLVALLAMRRADLHPRELVPRAKGQIREGIRYVWETTPLRVPMIAMLVVFTFAFNWQVLIPLYATRDLGGHAGLFGAIMAVFGVGSLAGALIMAGRSSRPNPRRLAVLSLTLAACTVAMVAVLTPGVAFAGAALVGAAGIAFAITANSTLQLTADERMRGRVMSLYSVIFLGSTPIGGALAGVVGEAWGARAGLILGAAAAAIAGVWLLARVRAGGVTVPAAVPVARPAAQPDAADAAGS